MKGSPRFSEATTVSVGVMCMLMGFVASSDQRLSMTQISVKQFVQYFETLRHFFCVGHLLQDGLANIFQSLDHCFILVFGLRRGGHDLFKPQEAVQGAGPRGLIHS